MHVENFSCSSFFSLERSYTVILCLACYRISIITGSRNIFMDPFQFLASFSVTGIHLHFIGK